MSALDDLKLKIKQCKTKKELDNLRLPIIQFARTSEGLPDGFYQLQKIFKTQKRKVK